MLVLMWQTNNKNKTHFNCAVTGKPDFTGHTFRSVDVEVLKLKETFVWVSVAFDDMHLFMGGSW